MKQVFNRMQLLEYWNNNACGGEFLLEDEEINNLLRFHHDYPQIQQLASENLQFFVTNFEIIAQWLTSIEFITTYKTKAHPYPPLLNPKQVDYRQIPAEFAWRINLPLQETYKFIWFHKGSSASAATMEFFKKCGILAPNHGGDSFFAYKQMYETKQDKIAYIYPLNWKESHYKFAHLITKKCPIFWIMRDPISVLKHALNHIENYTAESCILPIQKSFNLTTPYSFPMPFYYYCDMKHYPRVEFLENVLNAPQNWGLKERLEKFKGQASEFVCIEFNAMSLENAFETFKKLSKKFDFAPPKEQDRNFFSHRINKNNGELLALPATLYADSKDIENMFCATEPLKNIPNTDSIGSGIPIVISKLSLQEDKENYKDITREMIGEIVELESQFDDLLVLIESENYIKLQKNKLLYNAVRKYLQGYVKALIRHAKDINSRLISERDILDFLKTQPALRQRLAEKLDDELQFVKEHHKEYLKKWKYYQEFLKMM